MAVATSVTLPAQPVVGLVQQIALAGDGYSAPHSMTYIRQTTTDDASGSQSTSTIIFDPRWVSVPTWLSVSVFSLAADEDIAFTYRITDQLGMGVVLSCQNLGFPGVDPQVTWAPPAHPASVPTVGAGQPNVRAGKDNNDSEVWQFNAVVLNFRKDVLQRVPLPWLLMAMPRGTTGN